jgi:putative redox protein
VVTTTVLWKEGMHFCTQTQSGRLMCDESSEIGRAYPSSPELLMASLGSCVASVLVLYGEHHGMALEGLRVELDWTIADRPHRVGEIRLRVSLPRGIPGDQRPILERVAHTCLIHNTLTHPPRISMEMEYAGNGREARGEGR